MNGVFRRLGVLLCLLVLVGVVPAVAQVSTGEIFGKATDGTGAILPGVMVTLSGPALIQPQSVVTSESGGYRFPRIPIGTYTVTFDLTGFKKLVRADVVIQAGFNAAIDAKLELSTVQETVTVTGESPVVDTRSTAIAANFSKEALDKIPSARDPWVVLEQVPGMLMSGSNVGGNLSGQQTSFTAFGSSSNQQWNIDGAVISDIASGNSSPTYYDFDSFEEIQITTGGSDASQQGAGVQINFVTKSGGNTLRGSSRFYDTNQKYEANNITTAQRDRGAAGGNPIQDIKDYGFEIGGPIKKNKMWYWGAASNNTIHVGVVNFFDTAAGNCATVAANKDNKNADGSYQYAIQDLWNCYKTDETVLLNYNGKLQYQENASNKSSFTITDGIKTRNARGADAFTPLIATRRQDGPTLFYRLDHQWIMSNRLTVTAQYLHIHEHWGLFFQDPSLVDVQPISFVDTSFVDRNTTSGNYDTNRPQDSINADANYFLSNFLGGDHAMKFGFVYRRSPVESITTYGGGATERIRSTANQGNCTVGGATAVCNEADIRRDSDFSYILYSRSLYWNDSYKTGRLTINGGLRFDRQFDIARAAATPANRILPDLLPAIKFAGADSGARFNNLSPRVGFTYDLRGNGKTVAKLITGRYYGLGMSTASTLQPTNATTLRYAWRDVNGDGNVQRSELDFVRGFLTTPSSNYDPANPSALTTPARVDPNLKNDITDELIFGLDHELMPNFGVGGSYIYRKYHQFQATYRTDPGDITATYVPVTFTGVCGNATCSQPSYTGVYFQRPTALHTPTLLRNNGSSSTYNGIEFSARKRLANRWMLSGSIVRNNQKRFDPNPITLGADGVPTGDYLDPTNHISITGADYINGYEDSSRSGRWVGKLSGLFQFPWGINAAANYNGHTSFPLNTNIVSGNRTGSLGTATVYLQPFNTLRYATLHQLDVHVDKTLGFGKQRRVALNFDLFNIMNNNVILGQTTRQNTSTANNITTLLAPRVARFGVKVNF